MNRSGVFSSWLAAALLSLAVTSVVPARAWMVTRHGSGDGNAIAKGVRFDAAGDVVAGGILVSAGDTRIGAVKISHDGDLLWETHALDGWGGAMGISSAGDALVGGAVESAWSGGHIGVARLANSDGHVISQYESTGSGNHWVSAVLGTADGGMVIGGSGRSSSTSSNGVFYVRRMTGVWSQAISTSVYPDSPGSGVALGLAQDANGDILAVGRSNGVAVDQWGRYVYDPPHMIIVKLSFADGSILWQKVLSEISQGLSVAVDAAGDVVATGYIEQVEEAGNKDFAVVKLSGSDGGELWRFVVDGGGGNDTAGPVAVDPAGDIVVGGVIDLGPFEPSLILPSGHGLFSVFKIAGADGAEIWRTQVVNDVEQAAESSFTPGVRGQANALSIDTAGKVVVAGTLNATWLSSGAFQARHFVVVKMDASDGAVEWTQNLGDGEAFDVDTDAQGMIAVAGQMRRQIASGGTEEDFVVVGLSDLITGDQVRVSGGDPSRRSLKLKVKDGMIEVQAPGSTGDPTLHGAALVMTEAGSMEASTFNLPPSHWKALRRGYQYSDRKNENGPCSLVKIRKGKIIAKCKGASVDVVARHAPLAGLGVRLELGSGGAPLCMEFGGDVRRNDETRFEARSAPAPVTCLGM